MKRRNSKKPHHRGTNSCSCSSFVLVLDSGASSRTKDEDEHESPRFRFVHLTLLGLILLFAAGCAAPQSRLRTDGRHFVFRQDSFAYANALVWHYEFDAS